MEPAGRSEPRSKARFSATPTTNSQPPSMRRLPPVKQKNPLQCWTSRFPAPPLAYDTFRSLNSIAAVGPPCALAPPDSLVCATSLPFALAPCSARFQLESVVRALPSLSRSQSADRLSYPQTGSKAVRSRPDAAAWTRVLWQRSYQGNTLMPLSSLSSSQHSTCSNRLRFRSTAAARCLAVGPAACLPAN